MKNQERKLIVFARVFLFVIYIIGVIGISSSAFSERYVQLTPLTLLISAVILFAFHNPWNKRFVLVATGIALAGYLIEVLGVQTGLVFGEYSYGPVLGVQLLDVPLIIAVNWLILIYCTWYIAGKLIRKGWLRVPLTAALMVIFDLLMEPVAMELNMWQWKGSLPAFHNYTAWFILSLIFAGILQLFKIGVKNPVAVYLFLAMAMFFGVLNLVNL